MRLAPERTLAGGRYRLRRRLAAGGMASVWLAQDERLSRPVALKLIADTLADDDGWLERFEREARAAAAVSHPNVVPVYDFGVEGGRPYLVMAYVDGPSLATALAHGSAIDPLRLARELLDAVAHVHDAGILHRDIKPANVLLDSGGSTHLSDFGIARHGDASTLTKTGMVIGTRSYLAPEVAAGQPATVASDLYGVGRVLADVAAHRQPPEALALLIGALTAPDPAARPRSAAAALQLLNAPLEQPTPSTIRLVRVHRARPLRKAIITRALPLGALAIALVVLLLVTVTGGGHGNLRYGASASQVPPPTAPLRSQLGALNAAINRAAAGR